MGVEPLYMLVHMHGCAAPKSLLQGAMTRDVVDVRRPQAAYPFGKGGK